jgi:hypothetical protein
MSNTQSQSMKGKVSLSLDTWTSSNGIAFLAIVAHYVTNEGELGMSPFISFICTFFSIDE